MPGDDVPMEDLLADSDGATTQDSSPVAPSPPPSPPRRGRPRRASTPIAPTDDKDSDEGRKLRDTSKMIDFTLADEFTVIYPALAVLAVRSDEAPFFLARVNYDVTAGAEEFSITWLDAEPEGQVVLFESDEEDIIALGSVICRVRTEIDPDTALIRLPIDQREKIENIMKEEKINPDYEYHSSDERLDEPTYLDRYRASSSKKSNMANLTGRKRKAQDSDAGAESEEENEEPKPKRRRGRPRGSTNKSTVDEEEEFEETDLLSPKRARGRPRLSAEEKARRAEERANKSSSGDTPSTPRRRGRPRKVKVEDEEFVMPEEIPDLPMEDTPTSPRRRSPGRTPRTPRRAKSPTGKGRSRSPRRKKNQPALGVQVIEQDPTYCVDSTQIEETCCAACTSKIEPLRATLTDNGELLKELIEDRKRVANILVPRGVSLSVGAMTVAMRRALLTVPEKEEEEEQAMTTLRDKAIRAAEEKLEKAERKKQAKQAAKDGTPAPVEDTNNAPEHETDDEEEENDVEMNDEDSPQLSMSMIEGATPGEELAPEETRSALDKVLADEHNHFTSLRLLCAGSEFYYDRLRLPTPDVEQMDTGHASSYSHRRSGQIGASRGGKQGNNALLTDSSVYYTGNGWPSYGNVDSAYSAALGETIRLPHVSYPCVRSLRYLFPEYEHMFYDVVPIALRAGQRRLAARVIDEMMGPDDGFNFLHREILAFEHDEPLSSIRNVTSVTKKGLENITPLHCACISPTGTYLEQLLKLKPDALMLTDTAGYEPIHYAAAGESPEPLRVLLSRNVVLSTMAEGHTPLMIAARYGRVENVQALLAGREPDEIKILLEQTGENRQTAAHIAALHNQTAVLELLSTLIHDTAEKIIQAALDAQSDTEKKRKPTCTLRNLFEKPNRLGQTALSVACTQGNFPAVEVLLKLGVKIDKPDKQKRTPLIHAVMNGFLKIASYLVRQGADPSLGDSSGNTPLHYASAYGWKEVVRFLVTPQGTEDAPQPGAGVQANPCNDWKLTPFGIAVAKRHTGVADVLLQCPDVDINVTDDDGRSLVIQTCCHKITQDSLKQLEYFVVSKGARVDCVDMNGNSALHHLVKQSPAYVAPDSSYTSALESYRETSGWQQQMIQILLDHDIDVAGMNKKGKNVLQLALEKKALPVLHLLVSHEKAPLDFVVPSTGENILHLLLCRIEDQPIIPLLEIIRKHLGISAYDTLLQNEDHWGFTPFLLFFRARVMPTRDLRVDTHVRLLRATLQWLLQNTEVSLLTQTVGRLKQWREYSDEELTAFATQLKSQKREVTTRHELNQALQEYKKDTIEEVVAIFDSDPTWEVNPWPREDSCQDRPRSYTTESRALQALHLSPLMRKIMGEEELDEDEKSTDVPNPLVGPFYQESEIALNTPGFSDWGKCSVLHMIPTQSPTLWNWLKGSYAVSLRPMLGQWNIHGYAPLHLLLMEGHTTMASDLIQLGAKVTEAYQYGQKRTPLHLAVKLSHKDLVRQILGAGASVDTQDALHETPLHVACQRRWKKGLLILLQQGASVHQITKEGLTPLHLAVIASRGVAASFEIEEILLNHQADVNVRDIYGRTALHHAFDVPSPRQCNASQHRPSPADPIETVFSFCEVQDIEVDVPDCLGNSPLAYACLSSALISANNLIAKGADIFRYNQDKNSPLALALFAGRADFAISLLHSDAKMDDLLHITGREYKTIPFSPAPRYYVRIKSERHVPLFRYAVEHNWHGIAYTMLSRNFPYEQAVGDALACSQYQYVEMLLRKARSIPRFDTKDDKERNLFHSLARICEASDGEWSLRIAKQFRAKHVSPMALDVKGRTPLHYAAQQFNLPLCRYLLAMQGEIIENVDSDNEEDTLYMDMGEGEESLNVSSGCNANPNLTDNAGFSPFAYLFRDVKESQLTNTPREWKAIVELFLTYHGNPNILVPPRTSGLCRNLSQYISPLHMLMEWAKPDRTSREAVFGLLAEFFRAPPFKFSLDQPDGQGRPILFHAIMENDTELVTHLLRLGASTQVCDHQGKTALHYVVQPLPYGTYENVTLLQLLATAGAPVDEKDKNGFTPYHYARTTQTSPKMSNWFATRLGSSGEKAPLSRTPSRFTEGITLPPTPDWNADARAALEQVQVTTQKVDIKLDPKMTERGHRVLYCDPDDPERPYHAIMTRVDVRQGSCGQNDFYKLQIAHDTNKDLYILFTKWGRIGSTGQYQRTPFANGEDAVKEFEKVFKQKSGNAWAHYPDGYRRQADKYHVVPEKREITQRGEPLLPIDLLLEERKAQGLSAPVCSLAPALASLMKELCDIKKMKHTVHVEMNLQTPLGFLDQQTVQDALKLLGKALSTCEELKTIRKAWQADMSQEANVDEIRRLGERIETLSNEFYQLIPHNCETREGIPLLDDKQIIAKKYQTLDSLGEIATAGRLLLAAQYACRTKGVHPYDYVYACLATQMEELNQDSDEFRVIARACPRKIATILTVIREEEPARMAKWAHVPNHHLLWHGTSLTNYLGIFSHGLQIAPPEAPSTGMLLGKGIYHSDAFEKANHYAQGSPTLLMLNEVALGTSYVLKEPQYMEKTPSGYQSTLGTGLQQPRRERSITLPNGLVVHHHKLHMVKENDNVRASSFRYNEFVVYDVSQVRMRYLIILK